MSVEVGTAFVTIVPSAKGFAGKLQSEMGGSLTKAGHEGGKRFGGGMSAGLMGLGSKVFAPLAAAGAAIGVGNFLKDSISEARESQKVGALTTQVIKSTGGAAKVTASQVGDLATAISNKTGIDDEAIQSASNLLLTFTGVRNEVGKGNDVFNQATQIATDMGAALGGDPKSSAIQLGKALNDPVKGITALQRVGVSFTEQQKSQIKTMVKSGDSLGAQKVILKELGKEFGGAAAASSTGGEKLAVAFGNFKEQIGTALLPVIDKVAGFLTTKIIPALSGFISGMQDGTGAGGAFIGFFKDIWTAATPIASFLTGTLVPALKVFFSFLGGNDTGVDGPFREMAVAGEAARKVITQIVTAVGGFVAVAAPMVVRFVTGTLVPLFQQAVAFLMTKVVPAIMGIVSAVRGYITVALPIVRAFVVGMMARIGPMMPQIRAIFAQIGSIIVGALNLIRGIIVAVTSVIGAVWRRWGSSIMNFIAAIFRSVVTIIGGALRIIQGVIKVVTSLIKGDWSGAWAGIKQIVSGAWQVIKGVVSAGFAAVKAVFSIAVTAVKALASRIWSDVKSAFSSGIDGAVGLVRALPGRITGALGNLGGILLGAGQQVIDGFKRGIENKIGEVRSTLQNLTSMLPDWKGPKKRDKSILTPAGRSVIQGFIDGIKQATPKVQAQLEGLTKALIRYGKTGLARSLSDENAALSRVTSKRLAVATALKAAQSKLSAALKVRDDYAGSVRSSFESFGRITDGGPAAETIINKLKGDLATAKTFQANLTALMKMGLSKSAYKQIVDAGVEQGGKTAAALVAGGKSSVGQVNSLVSQLSTTANSVASQASKALYQAGVDSAQGLVKGLQSQGSALATAAQKIAKTIVAQVKKALGIKSPSRVFADEVGAHIPTGVIRGIDSTQGLLDSRLNGMVGVPDFSAGTGSAAAGSPTAILQLLTTALERANLSATISAGSVDAALAGGMR